MRIRGIGAALAAAAALGVVANGAPAASKARDPVRPVLGNWEGTGPHGLALSFEFVRSAGQVAMAHLALGLPTGCRSAGIQAWDASATNVEYAAPGTVLHGPFPPLGPTQFELLIPPTRAAPFPVIMLGSFSNSRHGVLAVPRPRLRCGRGGWPKTLRFTLTAARRVSVADGLWTGSVTGAPSGAGGTVRIRVIDGGRIETDFAASYSCPPPGGGGNFEIGPLPTVGFLIAPDGSIGGRIARATLWSGRFRAGGRLEGNLTPLGCGTSPVPYAFTAVRAGP